jgi:PhnB protein
VKFIPYLHFNGNCEEAFNAYAKILSGQPPMFFRFGDSPMAASVGPDWAQKIMHVTLIAAGQTLNGCDAPSPHFEQPQGFRVCLDLDDEAEAERVFTPLSEGGKVSMALQETFWAKRFAMFSDRFGTPWMINVSKPMPM